MAQTFAEFMRERFGRGWAVKQRLTPRLKREGYDVAITPKRFGELEREWETETYGAPLVSLRAAAPALLASLKWAIARVPDDGSSHYAAAHEAIWAAEGRAGYEESD